jgi:molecular chaperone HscB
MPNPFETLGLAPTYAVDATDLEQRQRELNRAVHPDRHAGNSPASRRQALSRAMDVNQAYRTLCDPAARAEALFELLGVDAIALSTLTDPALLGDMMEQRELLDEVRRQKDVGRLQALKSRMAERQRQIVIALGLAFEPLLSPGAEAGAKSRQADLESTRRLFTELKYVRRFSEEVAAIEDEI